MKTKPPISLKLLSLLLISALALSTIAWYVAVYAPRSRAALGANGANLLFSPPSGTVPIGTDQSMTVTIAPVTGTEKISGIDMTFNAGGVLQIKDITVPSGLSTQLVKTISAQKGRISFVNTAPNDQLPATVQFQVVFASATTGSGSIQLDVAQSLVVGTVSSTKFDLGTDLAAITFSFNSTGTGTPAVPTATPTTTNTPTPISNIPTATPTLAPTATPSPTPAGPAFNFSMKFQGMPGLPKISTAMPVAIKLVKDGAPTIAGTVQMSPSANGIWNGTARLQTAGGTGYTLYIKGPRHLQKKICVNAPVETAVGTYRCSSANVTVSGTTNTFDLSRITMLVGDLPTQDGTVDSYDTSYIRQSLGSTVQADLNVADLNRDGIVDTQDMSLVIQALSIKYDEE